MLGRTLILRGRQPRAAGSSSSLIAAFRRAMFIQTETTPNPESLKFLPGKAVLPADAGVMARDFKSFKESQASPLAKKIFQIEGVSGVFLADECLAGRMPSKGSETCLVVEQLYSLNIVHEVQGDPFFAERAETIAYNALPSTGTKDMWTRVYLQQPNEIFAGHVDPHPWNTDGGDSTTYSLGDNYFCCTANFNQGWPRFIAHMLHASPDGGVAVSTLGPVSARLAGGEAGEASARAVGQAQDLQR